MFPPRHVSPAAWESPAGPGSQQQEQNPEIFIGRVPQHMTKEALEVHFAPYGATNFRVLEGKGCAFCSFSTWAAAEAAMQALNGLKLDGGLGEGINVKFADVKGAPKGKMQQHPKVFIGNVAAHVTEDVVTEVCSQFGQITHTKIFARNQDSKPCAFVTFSTFSEAEVCISSLNGAEHAMATEGKVLNARLADAMGRKNPPPGAAGPAVVQPPGAAQLAMPMHMSRPAQLPTVVPLPFNPPGVQQQFGMGMRPGAPQPMGGMGGRPGTSGGTGPKIFIGGLPEAATEDFVWGMMAPFGDVTEAKIHRKGGAKPCGFARFATEEQAQNAIAMLGENGRFAVRQADDGKPNNKRPMTGMPGAMGMEQEMYGAPMGGRAAVRRLH